MESNFEKTGTKVIQTITVAEKKILENLAYASRILSLNDHDDFNQGQVSSRMPNSSHFFIKEAIVGFSEAIPENMVKAFIDHKVKQVPQVPPELSLHQAIYEARPDVNAVIHSHALNALAFGATDLNLDSISHEGACFHGEIDRFTFTSQTILNINIARKVAEKLQEKKALFLRNHGLLVVGKTLREAVVLALVLERACKLQLLLHSTGLPYTISNELDIKQKKEYIFERTAVKTYWEYWTRRVKQLKLNEWE